MQAPAGPCRKQKPTLTKLWPWRDVRIEGKSLNFYDDENAISDLEKRGSSIEDVTGCTVGRARETFRFDLEPGDYWVVTLQRKGHANGLPDLLPPFGTEPDGVARFCFKEEAERECFVNALTHLAAGRAWDGGGSGGQMVEPLLPEDKPPEPCGMGIFAGIGAQLSQPLPQQPLPQQQPAGGAMPVHTSAEIKNEHSPWGKVSCQHLAYYVNQETHRISLFTPREGLFGLTEHPDPAAFRRRWLEMAHVVQMGFGISAPTINAQSPWIKVTHADIGDRVTFDIGDLAYYANQQTRELSLLAPTAWGVMRIRAFSDFGRFEGNWLNLATQGGGGTMTVMPDVPASPVSGRTLATAQFKPAYEQAGRHSLDEHSLELQVQRLVRDYCHKHRIPYEGDEGERFFDDMISDLTEWVQFAGGTRTIPHRAQYLWTLARKLRGREMCSMLCEALRDDDASRIGPAAALTREINKLCVTVPPREPFPEQWICYRGGGFDDQFRNFFFPGRKFRQPAFLATSFSETVARKTFMRNVLWKINIHKRDKSVNCSLVENSEFPQESEYLFVPYSVFTVHHASWREGTTEDPHIIELYAATDNKRESEDLPLAPWS